MLGLERVIADHPARLASGTELRRHQIDALAGMLTELISRNERHEENGNGPERRRRGLRGRARRAGRRRDRGRSDDDLEPEVKPEDDPGAERRFRFRHPTASGKTIAAAGFVEAARTMGDPDPHAPPAAREPVHDGPDHRGLRRPLPPRDRGRLGAARRQPDHDPDLRLVRAPRRLALAHGVPARHLRRGAHRARREDERRDPQLPRAALRRDDRDRAAHREAGLRRLPGLGGRPAARRRRPARADRPAALAADSSGGRDLVGADRRRRLRPGGAGQGARPRADQPGGREPLPRPLRRDARDRLRRRRRARLQPGAGVPRGRDQGRGRERQDAAAQAGRDARRLRARRDQRPRERAAPRRGLELTARDGLHAPRAHGQPPRLPAAHRPRHAHASPQGGRRRRRLRRPGRDAQRPHGHDPLAARLGLLPAGRASHAGAAPPRPAARPPQALAGGLARPGHVGSAPPRPRHPAGVGADQPRQARRRRADALGGDRGPPAALRRAAAVRREARQGERGNAARRSS